MEYGPHNHTPNVFLSYRREDAGTFALWLADRLKRDLRLENVFLDLRDVFGGDDWRGVIADRIAASDVVIALIGARWTGPRRNGTWRIFDADDVVRWELGYALNLRPSHVVPTMLNGARLPSVLPRELTPLYHAQRLNLRPPDSPVCYRELLADVFMKAFYRRGGPIIITDGSDEAEVHLDRLAHQLKNGWLGMHGVIAVTAVTRGFAAINLREASANWPDVIVLRHPGADEEKLAALTRGVLRNTSKVVQAGVVGGTAGVTFELGRNLIQPPSTPGPPLGTDPVGSTPTPSTPASAPSASPSDGAVGRWARNGQADPASPTSTTGTATGSARAGIRLAAKLAAVGLGTAAAVAVGATVVNSSPTPLKPSAAAPATREGAPGITTSQSGEAPASERPSIIPTECSTDPFWGRDGQRSSVEPGRPLQCIYQYDGAAFHFSEITVFNGTAPMHRRAQEVKDNGQEVPIQGTDGARMIDSPRDVNRMLVSVGDESLYIAYHGTRDDAIAAVERLLHLR